MLALGLAALSLAAASVSAAPHTESPRFLLVSPSCAQADAPACLHYAGAYGSVYAAEHVYLASADCLEGNALNDFVGRHFLGELSTDEKRTTVWVGMAGLEGAPYGVAGVWEGMQSNARMIMAQHASSTSGQTTFGTIPSLELVLETGGSLILSVPEALLPQLDTLLPPHLAAVAIPTDARLAPVPVEQSLLDNLSNLTRHLKFSSEIDAIVDGLDDHQLVKDVRWLTGESSDIESRHSFHADALRASEWIRGKSHRFL